MTPYNRIRPNMPCATTKSKSLTLTMFWILGCHDCSCSQKGEALTTATNQSTQPWWFPHHNILIVSAHRLTCKTTYLTTPQVESALCNTQALVSGCHTYNWDKYQNWITHNSRYHSFNSLTPWSRWPDPAAVEPADGHQGGLCGGAPRRHLPTVRCRRGHKRPGEDRLHHHHHHPARALLNL